MNEAETRSELIDPALKAAGWGVVDTSRVRRKIITRGRLQGAGRRSEQDIADYVPTDRTLQRAVIEAKRRDLHAGVGAFAGRGHGMNRMPSHAAKHPMIPTMIGKM